MPGGESFERNFSLAFRIASARCRTHRAVLSFLGTRRQQRALNPCLTALQLKLEHIVLPCLFLEASRCVVVSSRWAPRIHTANAEQRSDRQEPSLRAPAISNHISHSASPREALRLVQSPWADFTFRRPRKSFSLPPENNPALNALIFVRLAVEKSHVSGNRRPQFIPMRSPFLPIDPAPLTAPNA
jgi:hypothetical protein